MIKISSICLNCSKKISSYYRYPNKFCSKSCATSYRNKINNPMTDKVTREKMRITKLQGYKDGKFKSWNQGLTKETDDRLVKAGINISKIKKQQFKQGIYKPFYGNQNPSTIPKIKEKIRQARKKQICPIRPTSYENKIINLIEKFNLPFKYVGNGKVWLGNFNPDFIECNGKKLLIETYCSYWHIQNYEKQRYAIFKKYGNFRTLFINEDDLERKDWESHNLNKILKFIEEGEKIR
jgi:hypothetical protein